MLYYFKKPYATPENIEKGKKTSKNFDEQIEDSKQIIFTVESKLNLVFYIAGNFLVKKDVLNIKYFRKR